MLYSDPATALQCTYAAYAISNNSAVGYSNVWVKIDSFSGTIVKLGGGDPGIYALGPLPAGQSKMVFVYLQATNVTSTPQTHTVRVYNGYPTTGTQLTNVTFSVTVLSPGANNSSKIYHVTNAPTSPVLGGFVTIYISGDCGQVQSSDTIDFTPASFTNWNAAAFELISASITLTNKNGQTTNIVNFLRLPADVPVWANGALTYHATYVFHCNEVTANNTPVSPLTYATQGRTATHTPPSAFGSFAPIQPPTNTTVLQKLASVTQLYTNETLTYTLRVTNSGLHAVVLHRFVDTLPPGFAYVTGSSKFNGVTILDPNVSGSVLTWSESYTTPPTSSSDLTFLAIPSINGYATNAVVAYVQDTVIDATLTTTDNVPATASARVLLSPTALDDTGTTLEDTPLTVPAPGVLLNDIEPNGFPITVVSYTQPAHGTVTVSTNGAYTYTPATNYYGSDSFTYTLTNGNGRTSAATVNLTITPVNDPPSFTGGTNQTVLMNAGPQAVSGWATAISPGPSNESAQTVAFQVSNDNTNLFSAQPSVSANGTLTYTPATNLSGIATVTVNLKDNGGTADGGIDTSPSQTFTILVIAYSIGNRLFNDLNNDGDRDFGEDGLGGVPMALFAADGAGNPTGNALMTTVSDAHGDYRFDHLAAGTYVVVVDQAAFPNLSGYTSSTGYCTNLTLSGDMRDHGKDIPVSVGSVTNGIASVAVTVGEGLQPTKELVANQPGAGQHGPCGDEHDNLVLDFGFTPTYSLGNRVFYDDDHDGQQDEGEAGVADVPMYAFAVDGNGCPTGSALAATTTDSNGWYRLDGLVAGTYAVVLDKAMATNLTEYTISIETSTNMTIAGDGWNHGWYFPQVNTGNITNGYASSPVTLGVDLQPLHEATNGASGAGAHGPNGDPYDNLVLDFGFSRTFCIGNRVFEDTDNDGYHDADEPGISNVALRIFAADQNGNPTGDAWVIGASNLNVAVTDTNGCYRFFRMVAGTYVVVVDVEMSRDLRGYASISGSTYQVEGAASTALVGYVSSTGYSTNLTLAGDLYDHGMDEPVSVGLVTNGIRSVAVTLREGLLPTGEWTNGVMGAGAHGPSGDTNDILVLDFGFTPTYSLGNRVFRDDGSGGGIPNNGIQDGTEPGIGNVAVHVRTNGTVVATTTTDTNGYYRFDGLRAGDYTVFLPAGNFAVTGHLAGYLSSTNTQPGDLGDKGLDDNAPETNGISSETISLGPGLPTGEATNGVAGAGAHGPLGDDYDNLTIDFGFLPKCSELCSVGSLVWHDRNNNGYYETDEDGIAGVLVEVWAADSSSNLLGTAAVASTTTDVNGLYFVGGLTAGLYRIKIPTNNFVAGGPLYATNTCSTLRFDEDTSVDDNNNGLQDEPGGAVLSPLFDLIGGGEATNGTGASDEYGPGYELDDAADPCGNMTIDFGFNAPVHDQPYLTSLGSLVWIDEDNDGVRDATETNGIPGVVVAMYALRGTERVFWGSVTTDVNGVYFFANLPPGTAVLHIAAANFAPGGPLHAYPLSGGTAVTNDNHSDDDNNAIQTNGMFTEAWSPLITLTVGTEPTNDLSGEFGTGYDQDDAGAYVDANGDMTMDFGFTPTYSIGNRVFSDADNDGTRDGDDGGINGVQVRLFAADSSGYPTGQVLAATTTDTNGFYRFDHLVKGTYVVVVDVTNSLSLAGYTSSSGATMDTTLSGDGQDHGKDAPVTVGAVTNGIAGVAVAVGAGLQPTNEATGAGAGANGPNGDASDNLTMDFGFTPTYSIGNRVYRDPDNDGQPDLDNLDEGGITGVVMALFAADGSGNPTGAPLATATTDVEGYYRFDGLVAGTYVVVVDKTNSPTLDLYLSVIGVSSDTSISGDLYDHGEDTPLGAGSVLPGGIASTPVTVGPGLQPVGEGTGPGQGANGPNGDANDNLVMDFGFYPLYSLGNRVFLDNGAGGGTTNNGVQDGTEPGVSNVAVKLFAADGSGQPTGTELSATTTDANGYYRFDNLPAGAFVVVVDLANSPSLSGYVSSTGTCTDTTIDGDLKDHGRDALVSVGSVTKGVASAPVVMGEFGLVAPTGETDVATGAGAHGPNSDDSDNLVMDFGFTLAASVAGSVLEDVNGNGVFDIEETNGVSGVTIALHTADGMPVATTVTSASGTYLFTNVPPGDYVILETDLPGWLSTADTEGANDNRIAVTLTSGQASTGNNFLDTQPGSVAGRVLEDVNGNGVFDAEDAAGVGGVLVVLETTNAVVVATNMTLPDGTYLFVNVAPGNYVVVETDLPGWLSTADTEGANDNRIAVTLTSGQASTGNNFLDVGYATISGAVLVDVNGNGIIDVEDNAGIGNVTVRLLDASSNLIAAATTTVAGAYSFTHVLPGSYAVEETDPSGYVSTGDSDGTNDNRIAAAIVSRQVSSGNIFLDAQPVTLGDFVWNDLNHDGIQDGGEPGFANIVVRLYNLSDAVIATTTSSVAGTYSLTNIAPGTYFLEFVVPAGFGFSPQSHGTDPALDSDPDPLTGRTTIFTLTSGVDDTTWDAGLDDDALGPVFVAFNVDGGVFTNYYYPAGLTVTGLVQDVGSGIYGGPSNRYVLYRGGIELASGEFTTRPETDGAAQAAPEPLAVTIPLDLIGYTGTYQLAVSAWDYDHDGPNDSTEGTNTFVFQVVPPPDYLYRMQITFAYDRDEALPDFPALVVFNESLPEFRYRQFASPTGGDLRFSDASGLQWLNFEPEQWNTNGNSYVWVRLPELSRTNNTIWAYWGSSRETNPPACTTNGATWAEPYRAVFHLHATSGTVALDSTTNRQHGTLQNMEATAWQTGLIGRALLFDGADEFVSNNVVTPWTGPFTVSLWVESGASSQPAGTALFAQHPEGFQIDCDGAVPGSYRYAGLNTLLIGQADERWIHLVVTHSGLTTRVYYDGLPVGEIPDAALPFTRYDIAAGTNRTGFFAGRIDEVRVEDVGRSSNWIWACWLNQYSNAAFVSFGVVERKGTLFQFDADVSSEGETLPLSESFEEIAPGPLHGANHWQTTPTTTNVAVQTHSVYHGARAVQLRQGHAWRGLPATPGTNLWVDWYARPTRRTAPPRDIAELHWNTTAAFYINTNGQVVALSNSTWVAFDTVIVSETNWSRFSVSLDHAQQRWSLYVADSAPNTLAVCVFTNLPFHATNGATLTSFRMSEEAAGVASYLDCLSVGAVAPLAVDTDGNGLPDTWELTCLGGTATDPAADTDTDGVSNFHEYLAGTHPGDGNSYLRIIGLDLESPTSSNIVVTVAGGACLGGSPYTSAGDAPRRTLGIEAANEDVTLPKLRITNITALVSGTSVWTDVRAALLYTNRYYAVSVAFAGASYTNREEWAMHTQPRRAGQRYLICVPVDYGSPAANNLRGTLGQQLARGLRPGATAAEADKLCYMDSDGVWQEFYLFTNANGALYWSDEISGTSTADVPVYPGMALWVVRGSGTAARANAVFTGRSFTTQSVVALSFTTNHGGWTAFGWPLPQPRWHRNLGPATPVDTLGFYPLGRGGTQWDPKAYPGQVGDQIWVWEDNTYRRWYWLIDHVGTNYNGRWWDNAATGVWKFANFALEVGRGYYYGHTTNWGGTNFLWRPTPP